MQQAKAFVEQGTQVGLQYWLQDWTLTSVLPQVLAATLDQASHWIVH